MRATVLLLTATIAVSPPTPQLHANGRIVFATDDGMASMNSDGSGQWGLRFTRIGEGAPAWSPDGSAIAFTDTRNGPQEIYAMDPDGTNVRQLTQVPFAADPSWSPDGKRIAFDDGSKLYAMSADGGAVVPLADGAHPAWSPDGATIAYDAYDAKGSEGIYSLDLASGRTTRLTTAPYSAEAPSWSPDGKRIAFDDGFEVYAMNGDGSGVAPLADGSQPAWSPDGAQIAFVRNGQVWTMRADGTGARQLTGGNYWSGSPAWQPLLPAPAGCTLWGTEANDLLVGTESDDVICGLGGDDTLVGLGGKDILYGGSGNDWLAGGLGVDALFGGPGDDRLDARDGYGDTVSGGPGLDTALLDPHAIDIPLGVERPIVSRNVSVWHPTTSSNQEPTNPSVLAVDGRIDDYWSSGGYPSQWLEVDLSYPTRVARIRLVTPDLPSGAMVLVLGKGAQPDSAYRLLHAFSGPTVFQQEVTYAPKRPWKGIRYVRLVVPSANAPIGWVAWPELEVDAAR
jgi:sugar lactone lactonase YvrE